MRLMILAIFVPMFAVACGGSPAGDVTDSTDDAAEALTAGQKSAIASAVEDDVHDSARHHARLSREDAIAALTDNEDSQAKVGKAINRAIPEGASAPFFGNVRAAGHEYLWMDVETDEGEGPTQMGTTYVFSASGKRVMTKDWTGSHDY